MCSMPVAQCSWDSFRAFGSDSDCTGIIGFIGKTVRCELMAEWGRKHFYRQSSKSIQRSPVETELKIDPIGSHARLPSWCTDALIICLVKFIFCSGARGLWVRIVGNFPLGALASLKIHWWSADLWGVVLALKKTVRFQEEWCVQELIVGYITCIIMC